MPLGGLEEGGYPQMPTVAVNEAHTLTGKQDESNGLKYGGTGRCLLAAMVRDVLYLHLLLYSI